MKENWGCAQSCLTLYGPGFSVHGIFQARILEWVAICSFRGSSWPWPRDQTRISCVSCIGGRSFIYHLSHQGSLYEIELCINKVLCKTKTKNRKPKQTIFSLISIYLCYFSIVDNHWLSSLHPFHQEKFVSLWTSCGVDYQKAWGSTSCYLPG